MTNSRLEGKGGLLISFEGIDKAGKTTQLEKLAALWRRLGIEFVLTREPGGTTLGETLRDILISGPEGSSIAPLTETLLMTAARAQHVEEVILPALSENKIVLCDRFVDSTVAYQGYGLGVDLHFIAGLNAVVTQGRQPDLTLLFDLPVEVAWSRKTSLGNDRIEERLMEFHQRVRAGFLAQAEADRKRIVKIAADADPATIHNQIVHLLEERFGSIVDGAM